jgi:hypothetical protein
MKKNSLIFIVTVSLISIVVGGCAKAPDLELKAAKMAIDSARVFEADKYVAMVFTTANDTLDATITEIEKQKNGNPFMCNYDKARKLLSSSRLTAQSAQMQAQEARQKMQADMDTSLTKETGLLVEIKDLLTKSKKDKTSLEVIKNQLSTIELSLGDAQIAKIEGRFADAFGMANAGIATLDSIKKDLVN